jgi:predicted Holliday junction resolvase-like endonuclease
MTRRISRREVKMLILQIVLLILLDLIVFLLLRIPVSPAELKKLLNKNKIKLEKDYRQVKRERILPKKLNYFEKRKAEAVEVLRQGNSKMDYGSYSRLVIICGAVGFIIGLIFNNIAMSIILSIGLTYAPIVVVKHFCNTFA